MLYRLTVSIQFFMCVSSIIHSTLLKLLCGVLTISHTIIEGISMRFKSFYVENRTTMPTLWLDIIIKMIHFIDDPSEKFSVFPS